MTDDARDHYVRLDSALGRVFVAYRGDAVTALRPAGPPQAFEAWFLARLGRPVSPAAAPWPALVDDVVEALATLGAHRVPVDLTSLGSFPRAVLSETAAIPAGEVRSYRQVAAAIGHPQAVRAVGTALARNPVPLLVPCHRVVRSDGTVGRYGFGSASKRRLLEQEGAVVGAAP